MFKNLEDKIEISFIMLIIGLFVGYTGNFFYTKKNYPTHQKCSLTVKQIREVAKINNYKGGNFQVCQEFNQLP
ncbi:MAG: hypothetical protein AABY22_06595 [Nanoarchaeota archaeon]